MESPAASTVLFADPPPLENLCIVSVSVSGIMKTIPATSRFQIQTIKCREIIFTEPDVIASPSLELDYVFHVILQISLHKTGRLQARLQKLGLEVSKPSYVNPAQYQSCLRYTLLAKLAPNWNKAGQWLVQGRDFLTTAGYANGIRMEVTVTTGELFFTIDASTVRFPSLKLEDLDVPAACYNNFLQNQSAVIHQHMIPMVWCHILPSMKKGTIMSISHCLPDDGPFRSYKEIKRHWKNHYGYRLPEDEDDMLYYQINFRPLGDKLFTYPEMCLRARDIQRVPRVDPKPIMITFLQDLQKKLPKICGYPLKLHNKAHYPTLDLQEVTQVEKRPNHNLSSKFPSKKVIYRNRSDIERLVSQTAESRKYPCTQSAQEIVSSTWQATEVRTNQTSQVIQDTATCSTESYEQRKHVEVPVFSARKSQNVLSRPVKSGINICSGQLNQNLAASQNQNKVIDPKLGCGNTGSRTLSNTSGQSGNINYATVSNDPSNGLLRKPVSTSTCVQRLTSVNTNSGTDMFAPPSTPKFHKPVGLILATPKSSKTVSLTPNSCKSASSTLCGTPSMKRPFTSSREGTPSVKKPRPKQQTQALDVEMFARSNQLNKVNTVTLISWLKERGVTCKSKDKKSDLVDKALKLLNLCVSEQ